MLQKRDCIRLNEYCENTTNKGHFQTNVKDMETAAANVKKLASIVIYKK